MRILLTAVNAKYIHSNLAVYSLRSAAGELSSHVELAEFTINHRIEEILREIFLRKPDLLLFSCYIWNIEYVKELAAECRKLMPGVPVWLGGPEVSYDAEEVLRKNPAVTGILTGEGEKSFRRLAEIAEGNYREGLGELPGAVYRDSEGRIRSNPRQGFAELSEIPFPYGDLADFEHRIIYYESSRGCPFSCSYCLSSIDKSVRFRDLELVKKELRFFLDARVPQVKFTDRTFNCRRSHALAIWDYIREHDNGVTNFHFEIAADLLEKEELDLMSRMRPGLIQLEIGVQSVNPRTIAEIHRRTDLEKLKKNVERVRKQGNIHQHLDLIAGLPYEDYKSFGNSFDEVYAMKPEQLQLGFLKVLKGSEMCRRAQEYGILYRDKPPYEVLSTKWLSFAEILQLKGIEEMVEIYYNSLQFRNTLERLVPAFPSPFAFFSGLAEYYRQEGLRGRNHGRQEKYEILLRFAKRQFPEEADLYRELLTVDYYLRERARKRPSFAPEQDAYKEEIQALLAEHGRQKHVEVLTKSRARKTYLLFDYEKRSPLTGDACVREVGGGDKIAESRRRRE